MAVDVSTVRLTNKLGPSFEASQWPSSPISYMALAPLARCHAIAFQVEPPTTHQNEVD